MGALARERRVGIRQLEQDAERMRVLIGLEGAPASSTDHGSLIGLGDDDHSQYLHLTAARNIQAQHQFAPTSAQPPFTLNANAQGQTVTGFSADQLQTLTPSNNPGATEKILKSTSAGHLQLVRLGLGVAPGYPLHVNGVIRTTNGSIYEETATLYISAVDDIFFSPGIGNKVTILTSRPLAWSGPGEITTASGDLTIDPVGNILLQPGGTKVQISASKTLEWAGAGFISTTSSHLTINPSGELLIQPANKVQISGGKTLEWTGAAVINTTSGDLDVTPNASFIFDTGSNFIRPNLSYEENLGSLQYKYLTLHAAELWVDTLVAQDTIATIGGRILVGPTTKLTQALTSTGGSDTIYVEHNEMTTNDVAYMEAQGKVEFIRIDSAGTPSSELLSNPGFETAGGGGGDIWANWIEVPGDGALANETTFVHSGLDAAKVTLGPSLNTGVYQEVTVTPGKKYRISFWSRGDGTNSSAYGVYDATASVYIINPQKTGITGTTYLQFTRDVITPVGCTTLRLVLTAGLVNGAVAYFDDASIRAVETSYTVTRNLDGTGPQAWDVGTAVFNTGQTNDGFMDLYSTAGVLSGYGPTIVGNVRNTSTWNDWSYRWAIGNIGGMYGQPADEYGVGIGNYGTDPSIVITNNAGIRFFDTGPNVIGQLSGTEWILGRVTASYNNIRIAAGLIQFRENTSVLAQLSGTEWLIGSTSTENVRITSSSIQMRDGTTVLTEFSGGNATFGQVAANQGNMHWNNSNKRLEFRGGTGGTTVEAYIDTSGAFVAGSGGQVVMDQDGLTIEATSAENAANSVNFNDTGGTEIARLVASDQSTYNYVTLKCIEEASHSAQVILTADAPTGDTSQIIFEGWSGSVYGNVQLLVDDGVGSIHDAVFKVGDATNPVVLLIGEPDGNGFMTHGLTIDQHATDDEVLAFKSSDDVAHGMTFLADTDTYSSFRKHDAASGGLQMRCLTEAQQSFRLNAYATTEDTTKSAAGRGNIEMNAALKSGSSATAHGADANLMVIRSNNNTRFIFDQEGSAHAEIEWTTFDDYDDVALLTRLDQLDPIKEEFAEFLAANQRALVEAGVANFSPDRPSHVMLNTTKLSMLLTGAIRQLAGRIEKLEEALA